MQHSGRQKQSQQPTQHSEVTFTQGTENILWIPTATQPACQNCLYTRSHQDLWTEDTTRRGQALQAHVCKAALLSWRGIAKMSMFEVTVRSTQTDTFTHHPEYLCNDRKWRKKKKKKELHYQIKLLRQDWRDKKQILVWSVQHFNKEYYRYNKHLLVYFNYKDSITY